MTAGGSSPSWTSTSGTSSPSPRTSSLVHRPNPAADSYVTHVPGLGVTHVPGLKRHPCSRLHGVSQRLTTVAPRTQRSAFGRMATCSSDGSTRPQRTRRSTLFGLDVYRGAVGLAGCARDGTSVSSVPPWFESGARVRRAPCVVRVHPAVRAVLALCSCSACAVHGARCFPAAVQPRRLHAVACAAERSCSRPARATGPLVPPCVPSGTRRAPCVSGEAWSDV